jgi:2-polyprenyl-6-hydroxyphenyl methylase/3-demethylubiquinone-9 3-methyltransferase
MPLLRNFIDLNRRMSRRFDRLFPERYRIAGGNDFKKHIVPAHLVADLRVYDVGGGSRPLISPEEKSSLGICVVGLDLDGDETGRAPVGAYDETIVADISRFRGRGDADLVVCKCVLEHVQDSEGAIQGISTILRPGGIALLFMPCRNAVFARINLFLPERIKRWMLFKIYPNKAGGHDGFEAFYDRCTPKEMRRLAEGAGLRVRRVWLYHQASYFIFFVPLYAVWRLWTVASSAIAGEQGVETFALELEKPRDP